MIKLIIFDLDGVLLDKNIHYLALADVLESLAGINLSYEEHEKYYDGRPTIQKLRLLENNKGLDPKLSDKIWSLKQGETFNMIKDLKPNEKNVELIQKLSKDYNLCLASNAIRSTVDIALDRLGLTKFLTPTISNEDVKLPKPYPSCYWKCMEHWRCLPQDTLVIEDSPVGIEGAKNSGAHVYECISADYLDYDKITSYIKRI
jgi:HAD superfamily hydrolase (TIGR01509 family)